MNHNLISLFETRVLAAPDSVAIVDGKRTITYGQIAELSSSLSRRLIKAGVVAADPVGLLSDRSIEWVIGILAILRIGGIYLPLSPELPLERRRLLMRKAGVKIVLHHPAVKNDLGDVAKIIEIATTSPNAPEETSPLVFPNSDCLEDRACVLFTSGSTGTPKGVVVRQSSIVRLVVNTNYIDLKPADVVAFASNTVFDAATFEVWGALLNGSRLVVIPSSILLSPSAFETFLGLHGVSTLFLTTELFNRIARSRPTAFRNLAWLLFGGEKANVDCVRGILECGAPPLNLLHMYGPTECTTFATFHRVTYVPSSATTIPIGKPISGCTIHLLNDQLQPVSEGEEGELCIAGNGLAEGYLHRPEETSAAFTTTSLNGTTIRIYRTGDLARLSEDGLIDFIGRRDGQIKLRGFRIEKGEVEATLLTHPGVRDALVLVYSGNNGSPRIGACLVMPSKPTESEIAGIRDFMTRQLPDHMVPTRLLAYDDFPLTASKKIDRQRLLADLEAVIDKTEPPVVPLDTVEERLFAIWQAVLGHPPRHPNENFFDAGGDSLQAVDLQLRIENEWSISLSPSFLLEAQNFDQIAKYVRNREAPDVRPVVWLTRTPMKPLMACVPGAFGHIFFFRSLATLWPDNWGLCGLPSRYLNPDGDRRLLSLEEIGEENLTRLENAEAAPVAAVAGYSFGGLVAYEMARRMAAQGNPPALVVYDTAAEGEENRGSILSNQGVPWWLHTGRVLKFAAMRTLYRRLLRQRGSAPSPFFYPAMANLVAVEPYLPQPYQGDMLLVRSTSTIVPPGVDAETLGWGKLVKGRLRVKTLSAEHADFFKPPHASEVAAITIEYLRQNDARWR